MASKRELRATYEYEKSLNKPGRVGSFSEWNRDRKIAEKESKPKPRYRYERQDVKLPGAALLITIGLFVLWLATTGNLKKIAQAWDFVRGKTENLPTSGGAAGSASGFTGIHDFSNYHVETHLAQPVISVTNTGGFN